MRYFKIFGNFLRLLELFKVFISCEVFFKDFVTGLFRKIITPEWLMALVILVYKLYWLLSVYSLELRLIALVRRKGPVSHFYAPDHIEQC